MIPANADNPTVFVIKATDRDKHIIYITCDAEEAVEVHEKWEEYHQDSAELIECSYAKDMAGWRPIMPPNQDLEWAD